MARRYWVKIGRQKVYAPNLRTLRAFAQHMANQLGQTLQTGFDPPPASFRARRNPDPGSYVDLWHEREKHRAARLAQNAATKAHRIALSMKRRSGRTYEKEVAARKTAKFVMVARSSRDAYKLYRPSKRAAEALAAEFEAAGYHTTIQPA
jgi:hypothetical protein